VMTELVQSWLARAPFVGRRRERWVCSRSSSESTLSAKLFQEEQKVAQDVRVAPADLQSEQATLTYLLGLTGIIDDESLELS
jgi:hypothetical protein